jgi:Skp family chaperone for outer membrane proteins
MIRTFAFLVLVGSLVSAAGAQLTVATVDLQEVFKSYYKTKEADGRLKEQLAQFKKEYQNMMADYQKMVEEAGKIRDEANDPVLSKEVRSEKEKTLQGKIQDVKNYERQLREYDVQRRKQLDDQSQRMRKSIVEDINKVIEGIGKTKNYNLIVDTSGVTMNGMPTILFRSNLPDLTSEVVTTMNAGRKDEPATAPPATRVQ